MCTAIQYIYQGLYAWMQKQKDNHFTFTLLGNVEKKRKLKVMAGNADCTKYKGHRTGTVQSQM